MSSANYSSYASPLQYPSPLHTSSPGSFAVGSNGDNSPLRHALPILSAILPPNVIPTPFTGSPLGYSRSSLPLDEQSPAHFASQTPTDMDKVFTAEEDVMVDEYEDESCMAEQDDMMAADEGQDMPVDLQDPELFPDAAVVEGGETYHHEYEMEPAELVDDDVEVLETAEVPLEGGYGNLSEEVKGADDKTQDVPELIFQGAVEQSEAHEAVSFGEEPSRYVQDLKDADAEPLGLEDSNTVPHGDHEGYIIKEGAEFSGNEVHADHNGSTNPDGNGNEAEESAYEGQRTEDEAPEFAASVLSTLSEAQNRTNREVNGNSYIAEHGTELEDEMGVGPDESREADQVHNGKAEGWENIAGTEQDSAHVEGEEEVYPGGDEGEYPYAEEEERTDQVEGGPQDDEVAYQEEEESVNTVEAIYDDDTVREEPYEEYEDEGGAYNDGEGVEDHESFLPYGDEELQQYDAVGEDLASSTVAQTMSGQLPAFVLEYQQTFYCMFSPLPSVPETDVLFLPSQEEQQVEWTVGQLAKELKELFDIESDVVLEFGDLDLSFYEGSPHISAKLDTLVQMHQALNSDAPSTEPMKVLLLECRNSFEKQWQSLNRLLEERQLGGRKRVRLDDDYEEASREQQEGDEVTKRPRLEESPMIQEEVQ